jgi:hypothetical protein
LDIERQKYNETSQKAVDEFLHSIAELAKLYLIQFKNVAAPAKEPIPPVVKPTRKGEHQKYAYEEIAIDF